MLILKACWSSEAFDQAQLVLLLRRSSEVLLIWRKLRWQLLSSQSTRRRQVWFHIPLASTAQMFLSQLQKLSVETGCNILLNTAMRKSIAFPAKASLEICSHLGLMQLFSTSLLHRKVQGGAGGKNNDIFMWLFSE